MTVLTWERFAEHGRGALRRVPAALGLAAGCAVLFLLVRHFARDIDYHALVQALRHTSNRALLWSLVATGISFVALIGRDMAALAAIGARPPLVATLLAGFCGTALGNAVGFGTLTGGAVRLRIYGAVGVGPEDIARLMVVIGLSFGLGLAGFAAAAALVEAPSVARLLGWPVGSLRIVAALVLAATLLLIALGGGRPLRLGRFSLPPLPRGLAVVQLGLTALDLVAAAAALWILLPGAPVDLVSFAALFSVATALGVISHVPGGLGVFEAVVVLSLGRRLPADAVAAALLAYRGIYFVVPLILSAALLAGFELRLLTPRHGPATRLARSAARLTPSFLGVIAFAAGAMLLVSGATPTFSHRLAILSLRLPLWVVEASHFLGSLAGVLFLFVARGLFHRLDGAWWLALVLSIASLGLSLAKGLAYTEACFLAALILLLLVTRRQFGRPASLLGQPFTLGWFAAVGITVAGAIGVLFFAFDDLRYARHLWWQFEFDAQAPRALRAMVGVSVLALSLGLWQLLRPPKGIAAPPDAAALARAREIIRTQERAEAQLALMADKSLLFSTSGHAFLMFGRRGRSWVALFDPVGPRTEWPELIWRFVELADAHGGRAGFYQVRPDSLPLYLDAGLKIMKLGEEARVTLERFSLAGSDRAGLRYALKRGERDGLAFELLPPERVPAALDELRAVSDAWLEARRASERGFSIAAFVPDYVGAQTVGLVRQAGRAVAFATVMATAMRQEVAVGLMRHVEDASPYAMEFLFTRLILHFKGEGYRVISLGMAPLSGLQPAPLASRWHRIGALIWRHGNRLYNFQGLRRFKGKFDPVWEPRYLAASGTIGPFVALADVAGLVGAGIKETRAA